MSVDKNHSDRFKRYLNGQMSSEEAHAFEREVLDDPFVMEALEGYEAHGKESLADLDKLKHQISSHKKTSFSLMRVAAVVALLILGSFTVYFFTRTIEEAQLAVEEESVEEYLQSSPAPDTIGLPDTKELVADDLVDMEDTQPKTFNQDGLKVADKDEVVAQLVIEEEEPEELAVERVNSETIAEIQEAEVSDKLIANDDADLTSALQGKVAGVQIRKSRAGSSTDSVELDEVVITAQPLVAEKRAVGNSTSTEVEKSDKRSMSEPTATLRSTSANETVSGVVMDDAGEPLPGVNVVIKGTTTGVTTDMDGNFELPKTSSQTLVVSYIGFESQEIEVGNRSYIDVTLGGATELQEVVVVGYGTEELVAGYTPARPAEGNRAFKKYLSENLSYPEAAITNEIEGTVVLELTIGVRGNISDISIKKSLGYGCDQEAIRLVNEGPNWSAAEKDGNKVEDKVKVRIRFKLK